MGKVIVSSQTAGDHVGYDKQSSVHDVLNGQTCCDLPVQPVWLDEDSLFVYSPTGLRASNKVRW